MHGSAKRWNTKSDQKMRYLIFLLVIFQLSCSSDVTVKTSKLGTSEFSVSSWSKGTQEQRATMVHSFLANHKVEGMEVKEVYALLGKSTAYYEYDEFPAYIIGPKSIESVYGKGYIFAFPIDRSTGKVRKYIIEPDIK